MINDDHEIMLNYNIILLTQFFRESKLPRITLRILLKLQRFLVHHYTLVFHHTSSPYVGSILFNATPPPEIKSQRYPVSEPKYQSLKNDMTATHTLPFVHNELQYRLTLGYNEELNSIIYFALHTSYSE